MGAPPAVAYTAPARVAYGKSELAVAGGLAGAPIDVVRCKTVDLVVPAWAEIVIEGEISTDALEQEAPFGEATGYVATRLMHPFFNVKCITHQKRSGSHEYRQPISAERKQHHASNVGGGDLHAVPERKLQCSRSGRRDVS